VKQSREKKIPLSLQAGKLPRKNLLLKRLLHAERSANVLIIEREFQH
jgi:hypothetical protein